MLEFINDDTIKLAHLSGIYTIICTKTNWFYIGESMNIKQRRKQHYNDLKNNRHHNTRMQLDYNLHGEDSFEFKIVQPHISYNELITKAELLILEDKYIAQYKDKYNLYNIENTLNDFLIGKRILQHSIDIPYYIDAVRKYIVSVLLKNNIIYHDGIFHIVRCPTLSDITKYKANQHRYKVAISKIPQQVLNKYFQLEEVRYLTDKKEINIKQEYKLVEIEPFYKWLEDNKMLELTDIIEENMSSHYFCF